MRQTIVDIARAAQVSTATVDRVLNERPGVRGPTRARVLAAARAIGYLPESEPAPAHRPVRLDFILQSGPNTFMDLLAEHLAGLGAARTAAADRACAPRRRLQPRGTGQQPARAARRQRWDRHHRPRPPGGARGDPRDRGRRDAGADPGLRHRARAAHRLCRHRQPQCRPARRPSARPLRAGIGRRGGAVRGLAQLSRPRGARDGLSPRPRRRVPEAADRRAARGPRRPRAQLSRGPAPAGGTPELRGIYNIGAGNRGIARALDEAGRATRWCSSATS